MPATSPEIETDAASWPVRCEIDPGEPAIALCTRCGAFISRAHRLVDEQGLAECTRCRGVVPSPRVASERQLGHPVGRFVRTVRDLLLTSNDFLRRLDPKGPLLPALVFGGLCIVLGQLAAFGWVRLLAPEAYQEMLAERVEDMGVTAGRLELLFLLALPVEALLRMFVCGLLLQLGALLSGGRRGLRYRDYVRLFAYASAGYLLLLIPLDAGLVLSFAFVLLISGRALRVHHGLSTGQAVLATIPLALGFVFLGMAGGR
jgi:hypothetical protein